MEIHKPYPNVLHLAFPNRKELTLTMCRPQEFYESVHENIRGHRFSWEDFLETFTDEDGQLDYFSFWSGFNFPGATFESFLKSFRGSLTRREQRLASVVESELDTSRPHYVIATLPDQTATIRHEMAHALFHVDPYYRMCAASQVSHLPAALRARLYAALSKMGYGENVHVDEIQAYLSTGTEDELQSRLGMGSEEFATFARAFRQTLCEHLGPEPVPATCPPPPPEMPVMAA